MGADRVQGRRRWLALLLLVALPLVPATAGAAFPRHRSFVELQAPERSLPIKQNPGRASRPVSTIPAGTPPVVATGRSRKVERALWIEVEHQGIRGWVPGRAMRRASAAPPTEPLNAPTEVFVEDLVCLGGPPGWKLVIDRDGSVDCSDGCRVNGKMVASPARRKPDKQAAWSILIRDSAGAPSMFVQLRHTGQCRDGASIARFAYRVAMRTTDGRKFYGCCNRIETAMP